MPLTRPVLHGILDGALYWRNWATVMLAPLAMLWQLSIPATVCVVHVVPGGAGGDATTSDDASASRYNVRATMAVEDEKHKVAERHEAAGASRTWRTGGFSNIGKHPLFALIARVQACRLDATVEASLALLQSSDHQVAKNPFVEPELSNSATQIHATRRPMLATRVPTLHHRY